MVSALDRAFGYVQIIASHLAGSRKRTFLTLIGLTIGITSLVSLISLGLGLQDQVTSQFKALGSNKIFIMPGGGITSSATSSASLTDADVSAIKRARGVQAVAPVSASSALVESGSFSVQTFVLGLDSSADTRAIFLESSSYGLDAGRSFTIGERGKAMVGWGILNGKYSFEGHAVPIGSVLTVDGRQFRVIGSIAKQGNPYDDTQVYLELQDAKALFGSDKYYSIIAQTEDGYPVDVAADNVKKKIRSERGLKAGEEDFSVQTAGQLLDSVNTILGLVGYVVAGIAVISLIVGGIGIMNTMYTSVLERTTEIGVMKAIGATEWDILFVFLLESGLLGLVGGAIGVSLGVAVAKAVELLAAFAGQESFYASFPPWLLLGALAFAFLVGTVSGIFPARRASRLAPVDAIRGY